MSLYLNSFKIFLLQLMHFGDIIFLDGYTVRNYVLDIICVIKCFQSIKKNEWVLLQQFAMQELYKTLIWTHIFNHRWFYYYCSFSIHLDLPCFYLFCCSISSCISVLSSTITKNPFSISFSVDPMAINSTRLFFVFCFEYVFSLHFSRALLLGIEF